MPRCTVIDCSNESESRGYCNKHYQRWRKYGSPMVRSKVAKGEWGNVYCSVEGCERNVKCKGICSMHYSRDMRLKNKGLPQRKPTKSDYAYYQT